MKLVTFLFQNSERIGALHPDGFIVDFTGANPALPATMQLLIEAGDEAITTARKCVSQAPQASRRALTGVQLLAPLPRPRRLRDGNLFLQHLEAYFKKVGKPMSEQFRRQTIYYNADHTHVFGPDADIPWPKDSNWIDYELEWACVIGKPGSAIKRENARTHVFGYTVFNDWSARDLQAEFMETGAGPGAGKDFANSLGPNITTSDEIDNPYSLKMTAHINGELWSSGSTADMAHKFEDAIHWFSRGAPIVAGEIIGSGTVLNGCGFELDRPLSVGDVVNLEVEGIGSLRNRVIRL
jgi:2-keto-4-pentenoate hydratase/2-oxohepta-3-ene-1,7-dioic acid hydratase in catechol pathway